MLAGRAGRPPGAKGLGDPFVHDIVLTFDDNFWGPAYATMRSLCLTSTDPRSLRFHVFHTGLRPDNRAIIQSIAGDYGAALHLTDLKQSDILGARIAAFPRIRMKRLNPIVYVRLFLKELLPAGTARVLYIDADTFVRNPIENLFAIDMQGKVIAAVLQPDRMHCIAGRDLKARSCFSMAEPYYNVGVMLIDLERYGQIDFIAGIKDLPAEELEQFYYDQDILNFVLRGQFLELDPRWNMQNPEPAHEVFDPHILHYSSDSRPWWPWTRVAFKRTYRHLMTNAHFYRYRREQYSRLVKGWLGLH